MAINAYISSSDPIIAEVKTETAEEAGIRDYIYIKGDPGPEGPPGPAGPQGPKGDTGQTGPKGDTGSTGPQGPKGDKGDTGADGAKGDKGDTGSQGAKGDKGDTGATGPKGDKGDKGDPGEYSSLNPPPYPVTSINNKTGAVSLGKSDVGLGNVDNVKQYSANNPPPYPVTSVNGQNGAVTVPTVTLPLSVQEGGTGGTDAATARTNLAIATQNSEQLTSGSLNMTAIRNNAGMKFIRCSTYPNSALNANTDYSVGTLSSAFRPALQISAYMQVGGSINALLTIKTDGTVTFRPFSAVGSTTGVNIHYAYI